MYCHRFLSHTDNAYRFPSYNCLAIDCRWSFLTFKRPSHSLITGVQPQRGLILLSYEHAIAVYQRDIELSVDGDLGDYRTNFASRRIFSPHILKRSSRRVLALSAKYPNLLHAFQRAMGRLGHLKVSESLLISNFEFRKSWFGAWVIAAPTLSRACDDWSHDSNKKSCVCHMEAMCEMSQLLSIDFFFSFSKLHIE